MLHLVRAWRSKLYVPESTLRAVDATLRDKRGVDTGSDLHPACDACSKRLAVRFAVESYGIKDKGRTAGGMPFTDVYARCHGEEQVIRIEGMDWQLDRDGELVRVAAIGALTFFIDGNVELRIPEKFFRAFVDAHNWGKRSGVRGGIV